MQEYATATGKLQITVLMPEQRTEWAAAFRPIHKKFEDIIGARLLEAVRAVAR
ncbi:MAG: hypothetical protein HY803_12340 [candidate division NC10 bacterium]|nr:hypothetical protein [candidate division NC10 bacterium]